MNRQNRDELEIKIPAGNSEIDLIDPKDEYIKLVNSFYEQLVTEHARTSNFPTDSDTNKYLDIALEKAFEKMHSNSATLKEASGIMNSILTGGQDSKPSRTESSDQKPNFQQREAEHKQAQSSSNPSQNPTSLFSNRNQRQVEVLGRSIYYISRGSSD